MNTNPQAKTILCYGDSNTRGTRPDRQGRYGANERWTGILQERLGNSYYVIEEGLGGRTTNLEHSSPDKPSRNGLTYFKACLESHMPMDFIILMLGSNDLKTTYHRSAQDIAQAVKLFPEYVKDFCAKRIQEPPKILLVSPAAMNARAPKFIESMPAPGIYDEMSAEKSRELANPIQHVAKETGCLFFDAAAVTKTGEDGCHLDQASHVLLGEKLAEIIRTN